MNDVTSSCEAPGRTANRNRPRQSGKIKLFSGKIFLAFANIFQSSTKIYKIYFVERYVTNHISGQRSSAVLKDYCSLTGEKYFLGPCWIFGCSTSNGHWKKLPHHPFGVRLVSSFYDTSTLCSLLACVGKAAAAAGVTLTSASRQAAPPAFAATVSPSVPPPCCGSSASVTHASPTKRLGQTSLTAPVGRRFLSRRLSRSQVGGVCRSSGSSSGIGDAVAAVISSKLRDGLAVPREQIGGVPAALPLVYFLFFFAFCCYLEGSVTSGDL